MKKMQKSPGRPDPVNGHGIRAMKKRPGKAVRRESGDTRSEGGDIGRQDGLSLARGLAIACLIAAAGLVVYSNSFRGPFILDGPESILDNPNIHSLWPIWRAMSSPPGETVSGRGVLGLSLAINYAVSGTNVWSYHAVNLAIHILAGILLFGIVRRTLLTERLAGLFARRATALAAVCALIWVVHPLQTEAVTYVIQRAESLMGLFYLLTIYCAVRGWRSPRRWAWYAAAIVACAAGMGTKEVMVTAPIMVVIYDRIFLAGTWRQAIRRRWGLYVGLFATWGILAVLLASNPRGGSAGFGIEHVTPIEYAMTQSRVIFHYLRLAIWPDPLVFDYAWPITRNFAAAAPWIFALACLLAGTVAALRYRPAAGFAGAWFFIILGPTSSFIPLFDAAFEHRMYLPLAGLVTAGVCAAYAIGQRLARHKALPMPAVLAGWALAAAVIVALSAATYRRNEDYSSALSIWSDTVAKRPANARARNNLAGAMEKLGDLDGAMRNYDAAIRLNDHYAPAYNGRGTIYSKKGDFDNAVRNCTRAIELDPNYAKAYNNRGIAFTEQGRAGLAIADFSRAIELDRQYAKAYCNRARAYDMKGLDTQAQGDCTRAIELDPNYVKAYANRGQARRRLGHYDQAIADFDTAIRLDRNFAPAYGGRGLVYAEMGKFDLALADFEAVLRLDPGNAMAMRYRQRVLKEMRRPASGAR